MAISKKTSARRKSLGAPTAASERKGRVSVPPQRLGGEVHVAGTKKSRDRPKSTGTRGRPAKAVTSKVIASKVVKKVGKVETPAKRGRPAKGSSTAASLKKSKGPKAEKVYNDELKSTASEYQVEEITNSRIRKNKIQYLVKWVGYPESESTWEPEVNVRNAQDKIKEFDIKFPDKAYPEPVVKKPTKVTASKAETAAEADTPAEDGNGVEVEDEAEAEVEVETPAEAEVSPEKSADESVTIDA